MTNNLKYLLIGLLWFSGQAFTAEDGFLEPPPVERFAAHAKYQNLVISPDGKHIAFTFEEKDNEVKLAIATTDLKEITAVFGFGKDYHIGNHFWASDEKVVMSMGKNRGFLDGRRQYGHFFIADYDGKNRRELFPGGGVRVLDRLKSEPKYILIGKIDFRSEGQLKLHKVNITNGKSNYIGGIPVPTGSAVVDVAVDTESKVRIAVELHRGKEKFDDVDDVTTFHYKTVNGEWRELVINQARRPARYRRLGFSPDNKLYYFLSNYDMARNDTMGVFSFDFESAQITPVFRHPDVDIQGGIYGPDGELLGVRYQPGYPEVHYFDHSNPRVKKLMSLSAAFPGQVVTVNSYTEDGSRAIVMVRSDRNPGEFYLYNDGNLKYLASVFPDINPKQMGRTEAFTLHARDGVKLYGYITLPPGRPDQNLPMVVHPHGGPFGPFDQWGYDARVQLLASHGYAVLQVNFRGSGGYGVDFEESGHGKWGREMQNDITDATMWAVQQGITDINRICIYGGSYGGYASLQAVVTEPDLYKCAIGVAGVYSLPLFRTHGDYRQNPEAAKVFLDKYVGKDEATLKAYSPAYNVDKIKAELFIIHGSKDVRVPYKQAKFLSAQLDQAGKSYEWMVRAEGHGFTQESNRVEQYALMLEFLDKNIGSGKLTLH